MTLRDLYARLMAAWGPDTAYNGLYHEETPCFNQCAVTALIVQDFFGGKIMRCDDVEGTGSHYFNKLPDGRTVDLTRAQFPPWARFTSPVPRTRDALLENKSTRERYNRLLGRIIG